MRIVGWGTVVLLAVVAVFLLSWDIQSDDHVPWWVAPAGTACAVGAGLAALFLEYYE